MTLSVADFNDETAHYAYQCATCSARYIVNVTPTQLYGYRQTPHGADEARAMALHCCHDDPQPASGVNVYWAASSVVGSQAHLHLGPAAIVDAPVIVRRSREWRATVVSGSMLWSRHQTTVPVELGSLGEHADTCEIHSYRIDVAIDDNPEGRARAWLLLLAGLHFNPYRGDEDLGARMSRTFQNAFCSACLKDLEDENGDGDLPRMFHAHHRVHIFDEISAAQRFRVMLRYTYEEPIPIAFMRLVMQGVERGVQQ